MISGLLSFQRRAALCALLCVSALSAQTTTGTVLPNGRRIEPLGTWTQVDPYPMAIAIKPNGTEAVLPSIGFPFALNIVHDPAGPQPHLDSIPHTAAEAAQIRTHAGVAYSPDGRQLYVATGNSGSVDIYDTTTWKQLSTIHLDGPIAGKLYSGSFAATLQLSASGRWLFVLDQGNWRVVVIDAQSGTLIASADTGAYPFALALSPDETKLYVTNTGLFEYKLIPGINPADIPGTALTFPPFAYPSKAAREGATVQGKKVPALGPENSLRGSSLWTYNLQPSGAISVSAKLRLGATISGQGIGVIGGAAPTGVVADSSAVYVALAHQDSVVKVTSDGKRLLAETPLSPFQGQRFLDAHGHPLRGVMPSGLALHNGTLYVAEAGINAVALLDTASMHLLSHIPVGWNPTAVALSPDGATLYVVNTKGKGTGPNGGAAHSAASPSYIGALEYGSLSAIPLDSLASPATLTAAVVDSNLAAIADHPALPNLKHCFLIIRENRTFDEVLGDIPGANGDPSLARYGLDGWAEERGSSAPIANHLQVTPNLHALASQFAISDNFFVDSDVSADGHRWVVGAAPTPFFDSAWTSNYGGRRSSSPAAEQPGRRALFGGDDAPMPEDEPEFGSLWEHVANSGKGILNYGEGLEVEGDDEVSGLEPEGQRLLLNSPVPRPIFEHSDRRFPTFNLGIPDQFRAAEFERDLRRRILNHDVPALIVIRLPGDHTSDPRPADGYPFHASFVADNDLALGRIIAFLSSTTLWKDSAVFVTEDDAQGGVDHIDAHRSILLVASPWVRPGAISHQHTSMGSITRTIDELLHLGPLNLEDALASEMIGIFASTPTLEPFRVRPADTHVFVAANARSARPKTKAEAAALRDIDDPAVIRPEVEATGHARRPAANASH
jgi:DNA-binding beta-propeller fold protein YncE